MPKRVRWTYTAARTTAHGCTLTVTATAASSDSFAWVVTVVGDGASEHIANGVASTMAMAMEQAEAAARRRAEEIEEASWQYTLF
ncbi:hypothetical protein CRT60_00885 [Azospirillum palustre]|uniref:Uncharacterized protein n=1 Tax=Azospirillum palustre TaxID=2044885 RepID=A0A2B8BN88_9PROT|nr:hypothetical protein [Azospirillum palustre]PGH59220.1 hypothetical protein CRT60_00885 [Azospirillum palustre]